MTRLLGWTRRIGLRGRVISVAVPPLIGMLLVASIPLAARWQHAADMARVVELSSLVTNVGGLVHELQRERGATNVMLSSGGAQFRAEVAVQRQATALAEPMFRAAVLRLGPASSAIASKFKFARDELDRLPDVRARADALQLPSPDSFGYFTDVIRALLDVVPDAGVATEDPAATRSTLALFNLMQSKERAGQERAAGAQGFATGRFPPELDQQFRYLRMEQNTFLQTFQSYANGAEQDSYRRIVAGPAIAEVMRLRAVADAGGLRGDLGGVDGPTWFKAATVRVDMLRAVEVALAGQTQRTAVEHRRSAQVEFAVLLGAVGGITVLVGAIAFATVRSLADPLRAMTVAMTALAGGDTAVRVAGGDRGDEIGAMSRALALLRDNRVLADRLRAGQAEASANRERRHTDLECHVGVFGDAVAGALRRLDAAGGAMLGTSSRLSGTASEAAGHAAAAAVAVSQAALNAQAVATAVQHLSSSAQEIGQQAATAAEKVAHATAQARKMEDIVAGLFAAAQQVGSVVAVVREMADQAGLLALNATIEAARAGQAGKSFTVVASEVKALARRTNQATETIAAQVATMQDVAHTGMAAVRAIARSVENMGASADAVTAGVAAQAAATVEITDRAYEIANGTVELRDSMLRADTAATATGYEAGEVREAAQALGEQVGILRARIEAFVCDIRAAA